MTATPCPQCELATNMLRDEIARAEKLRESLGVYMNEGRRLREEIAGLNKENDELKRRRP